MSIEKEIADTIKKLRSITKEFSKKERQKMLSEAAIPLRDEAKRNIPKSLRTHHRYKTSKASGKIRAPKGRGRIVATYEPGNLRNSIRILKFRRSSAVFVGPKVAKRGGGSGRYGRGRRVDGYYAAWIEFGTKHIRPVAYMRRAVGSQRAVVQRNILNAAKKRMKVWERRNAI